MATIRSPAPNVTLLDALHERLIAGFTLGGATRHPRQETTSAGFK